MPTEKNVQIAALLLRVSLGVMFIAHGLLKVMVFTMPEAAKFFALLGFPAWSAYAVTALEIIGGVLLLAGVATRWVILTLIPVMLGALYVHLGNGWVFSANNGGWEYPAMLLVAMVVQWLLGSGAFAMRLGRSQSVSPATGQAEINKLAH